MVFTPEEEKILKHLIAIESARAKLNIANKNLSMAIRSECQPIDTRIREEHRPIYEPLQQEFKTAEENLKKEFT
jgi:hypothetical protein